MTRPLIGRRHCARPSASARASTKSSLPAKTRSSPAAGAAVMGHSTDHAMLPSLMSNATSSLLWSGEVRVLIIEGWLERRRRGQRVRSTAPGAETSAARRRAAGTQTRQKLAPPHKIWWCGASAPRYNSVEPTNVSRSRLPARARSTQTQWLINISFICIVTPNFRCSTARAASTNSSIRRPGSRCRRWRSPNTGTCSRR